MSIKKIMYDNYGDDKVLIAIPSGTLNSPPDECSN